MINHLYVQLQHTANLCIDTSSLQRLVDLPQLQYDQLIQLLIDYPHDYARMNGCLLCTLRPNPDRTVQLLWGTIGIRDPSLIMEGVVALTQVRAPQELVHDLISILEDRVLDEADVLSIGAILYWVGIIPTRLANRSWYYYLLTHQSAVGLVVRQINLHEVNERKYFLDLIPNLNVDTTVNGHSYPFLAISRVLPIPDQETAEKASSELILRVLALFEQHSVGVVAQICMELLARLKVQEVSPSLQKRIITAYTTANTASDAELRYLVSAPAYQALIASDT